MVGWTKSGQNNTVPSVQNIHEIGDLIICIGLFTRIIKNYIDPQQKKVRRNAEPNPTTILDTMEYSAACL